MTVSTQFEIDGKEYELKITHESIKHLNKSEDNGVYGLLGNILKAEFNTYLNVVYAGLLHTKEGFTKEKVENAVYEKIEKQELDFDTIQKTMYHLVAENFFYKATMNKLLAKEPEAKKQIEELMK